jgi:hypothetical protein
LNEVLFQGVGVAMLPPMESEIAPG